MVFSGEPKIMTFGCVPKPTPENARAAVISVPLEATVSYGRGTSLGPAAIMNASCAMELFDELLGLEPIDFGILTLPPIKVNGTAEQTLDRLEAAVAEQLRAGRLPAVLGGEHTVSLGPIRALKKARGADFTVLVLDAHLDLRDRYLNDPLSHACVMRRVWDMGLKIQHVGSRSLSAEEADFIKQNQISPVWADQVDRDPEWIEKSLAGIEGPVYLSLDIDGLDPGIMPATGTPEPGGLSWRQVSDWLVAVCHRHEVVGLDLVELAPIGGQPAWDFTAARLLYRALGLALQNRK